MPGRAGEADHGGVDGVRVPDLRPHTTSLVGRPERLGHDPLNAGAFERLRPEQGHLEVRGRPHRHDRRTDVGEHVQEDLAALHVRTGPKVREARRWMGQDVEGYVRRRVLVGELPRAAGAGQSAGLRRGEAEVHGAVVCGEVHHGLAVYADCDACLIVGPYKRRSARLSRFVRSSTRPSKPGRGTWSGWVQWAGIASSP